MNKVFHILQFLLFITVCFLNVLFIIKNNLVSYNHVLYLFLLMIVFILFWKDSIQKKSIQKNKTYFIISILCFSIMCYILWRSMFDSNLFFNRFHDNNHVFLEYRMLFLKQNMFYFNSMLVLLLIYRKMNFEK